MRVLVTGAGGQLSRELLRVFAGEEVHARDHRSLDIMDQAAVMAAIREIRPQWITNAAAFNDVDGAETAQEEAFTVNAHGPGNLAAGAAEANAGIVHLSTDYVFDGGKGSACSEDDEPRPLSVYGRSKVRGRAASTGIESPGLRVTHRVALRDPWQELREGDPRCGEHWEAAQGGRGPGRQSNLLLRPGRSDQPAHPDARSLALPSLRMWQAALEDFLDNYSKLPPA